MIDAFNNPNMMKIIFFTNLIYIELIQSILEESNNNINIKMQKCVFLIKYIACTYLKTDFLEF